MLQLIKVPCILVSAVSIWYTLTPPQPPPAEEEHVEWTALEGILRRRYILFTLKVRHEILRVTIDYPVHSASLGVFLL